VSGPAPASVPGDNPFGLLLAVQDLDTAISQHEHRKATLPEKRELDEVGARTAALRRDQAELVAQRAELATRLSHLEEQTAAVVARRKALSDRLYSARGVPGRDLAAIETEMTQLASRKGELEDEEMVVLEEQEPLDAEFGRLSAELAGLDGRAGELARAVAEATRSIDAELAELRAARSERAARLPEALASRYETLRRHSGGLGAARLIGNSCDGCHLTLSAVEMDRIRHLPLDAVVTCDQCGRILVRPSLVGD
jgi:hypothetical protein